MGVVPEILGHNRHTGSEAVKAWTLLVLELEQLEKPGSLTRRGHNPKASPLIGQHHTGLRGFEELRAAVGKGVKEIHDVEVGHQGVRQLDERLRQLALRRHSDPSSVVGGLAWVWGCLFL
jgi:hypothetical protein